MKLPLPFNPMDVIDNAPDSAELSGPARIVDIQLTRGDPVVWLIDRERPHKKKLNQRKGYACQPYSRPLAELVELLDSCQCVILNIPPDPALLMKDEDRLAACKTDKQKAKLAKQFRERDCRFAAIKPLVCGHDSHAPLPIARLMEDAALARRIEERAKELGNAASTLRSWMNKYWSGGCQKSALLAGYHGRCGNPGKEKKQRVKLGRSTRPFKTGHCPSRGYPLDLQDKNRLGWGFSLINKTRPPRDAYLLMCAALWAVHERTPTGETRAKLFEKHLRPSFDQFMRWGAKLYKKTVREILLGPIKWKQERKTTGRSEQDSVIAVGQQAMFDGTSTDVYLVSCRNRLKRLPPMTRLILKESRVGLIYGLYCGWEAPSPQTALLAILHGAMKNKASWARRFGVDISDEAIPGLLPRAILTDNGELKGEVPTQFETQFGVAISNTPAGHGEAKGGVETEHMRLHAYLDHRLPGTTHGKARARGEKHAATEALWNYYEYMAELIRQIVWHNTEEEVPDLAPDDMLLTEPQVKPTRINIYNWLTRQGLNVSLHADYDALRAFTLPDVEAVICRNGIRVVAKVHGRKTRLFRLRYTSRALAATGLLAQVKASGKDIPTRIKLNDTDLSQAWLPTRSGMIRVTNSARDTLINTNLTLSEWIQYCEDQAIQNDLSAGDKEQAQADVVVCRKSVTDSAQAQVDIAIAAMKKKLSKRALIGDLERNRREEIELLRAQESELASSDATDHGEDTEPPAADTLLQLSSAADDAMAAYHKKRETE